ncbi:MAG: hypothetical protein D6738_01150 [Acidobacteria bacterium]|nr:MAG: hypothetical protein D6738_01150 [Acidobacteriota bacterium]
MLSRSSAKREFGSNNWLGPAVVFGGIALMVLFFLMRVATTEIPVEVPEVPALRDYPAVSVAYPRGALEQAVPPADAERLRDELLEWLLRWEPEGTAGVRRELYVFPDQRRALIEFRRLGGEQRRDPGEAARFLSGGTDVWFLRGRTLGRAVAVGEGVDPAAVAAAADELDRAVVRTWGAQS